MTGSLFYLQTSNFYIISTCYPVVLHKHKKNKGDSMIKKQICIQLATFFLLNKSTVRKTAKAFSLSKSTVHNYLHIRLKQYDKNLSKKVQKLLDKNKVEKHMRGGIATKLSFKNKRTS